MRLIEQNEHDSKHMLYLYKQKHGKDRKYEIATIGLELGLFIPLDVEYLLDDDMSEFEAEEYFKLAKERERRRKYR